jgi:hypothetical protein
MSRRSIERVNSINCYSMLRLWSATSASVLCGLGRMCSCSSLRAGLMIRSSFAEASSLRMRHAVLATLPLPFPRTRSRVGERDCASVESKLNRKFSGSEAVPVCISGIRMPTCLSSPLQASGRTIDPANIPVLHLPCVPARLSVIRIRSRSRVSQAADYPQAGSARGPETGLWEALGVSTKSLTGRWMWNLVGLQTQWPRLVKPSDVGGFVFTPTSAFPDTNWRTTTNNLQIPFSREHWISPEHNLSIPRFLRPGLIRG